MRLLVLLAAVTLASWGCYAGSGCTQTPTADRLTRR